MCSSALHASGYASHTPQTVSHWVESLQAAGISVMWFPSPILSDQISAPEFPWKSQKIKVEAKGYLFKLGCNKHL